MHEESKDVLAHQTNIDFQTELQAILSVPLSPEIINIYADHALEQVVMLAQRAIGSYSQQPTIDFRTSRGQEEAAFNYFSLGDVDRTLDHIDNKAQEIRKIDAIIARARQTQQIITPTATGSIGIVPGSGEDFREKNLIPRLKVLLFVASNSLKLDIENEAELRITEGALSESMVRKAPYYLVEMPTLGRTALVCDEEGNATFVLNNEFIQQFEISNQDIIKLTKTDIDDLIAENPTFGKKIKYYPETYVSKLAYYLSNDWKVDDPEEAIFEKPEQYLYPKAPEGYMIKDAIWREFGVGESSVKRAIKELAIISENYRDGSGRIHAYYSAENIALARNLLEDQGMFAENPPENFKHIKALAELWPEVSPYSIALALKDLGLNGTKYRQKGRPASKYYSPEDANMIRGVLESKGLFMPLPPEGYLGLTDLTKFLGLGKTNAIKKLIDELGIDGEEYRVQNGTIPHYSPENIEIIKQTLEAKGSFTGSAPDGYMILSEIIQALDVGAHDVVTSIGALSIKSEVYKGKAKRPEQFYSPDDIVKIRTLLDEKGRLTLEPAPEGYLLKDALWRTLGVSEGVVKKAIKDLGLEGHVFRSEKLNRSFAHYSPDDILAIREWLHQGQKDKVVVPDDGWSTATALAQYFSLDVTTIHRALNLTGIEGSTHLSKNSRKLFVYYSHEDRELLHEHFEQNGYFAEIAPEGYLTRNDLEEATGRSYDFIKRRLNDLEVEGTIYISPRTKRPERFYSSDMIDALEQTSKDEDLRK